MVCFRQLLELCSRVGRWGAGGFDGRVAVMSGLAHPVRARLCPVGGSRCGFSRTRSRTKKARTHVGLDPQSGTLQYNVIAMVRPLTAVHVHAHVVHVHVLCEEEEFLKKIY